MRFIPLSVLLFGSCLMLPAFADDGAALLRRLVDAERMQSFSGTFVYERNGSFSTHSIWHQAGADGDLRERLLQLDGSAQEVVRIDGRVQCASGALADQMIDSQLWPTRELDALQLSKYYELRVLGNSRVAGRTARVLALLPRDQHRYGIELHLDEQTGLSLKSLLVNDKGQLLERFQFTHLQTASPTDQDLQPGSGCRPVRVLPVQAAVASVWRSDWLPPGFSLSSVVQRLSPASDEPVACQVYGDGLARFSVFMEPLRGAAVEDVRTQLGPTVAVSRRLKTDDGDVMVTVVGEIPMGTAERIALSMRSATEVAQ
ncbi:RNA polymerase subunit sigma [Pseudomonas sp. HMWF032]|uniref:MucB/RseB C-terminal domain-containing protein n=1 Tax=unclassified Pseudomonas TaxID=196821 RepID=UPI000D3844FC|nr:MULTISPECIES: MucB/RseB C-terminal domain-containing protein [unclassified Pseudomonas]PTS82715.1 RNA polymerase subunit sigma [Pseudomonas sp. HMWF032]PTT80878.1 RNA polymerase subunit sigma [Pseudomonas sp. HMWF010]WAC43589.1 MucB/RseB C-terminal domain-containing protein [Pseudomonas sp. SL4(2022)]